MALATTALGQSAAHAASLEVTNLDDAGAGSLRDAITVANGASGADVITFAAGLTGTITLSTGQLTISDSLEIVGPGRGALTVDGGAASRVFDIPLSPGDVEVAISGLTVSNGSAQTGGGIRLQDETLTLDDVALIGNTAIGNGGGLYADGFAMTLTVRNSTISGNTARGGGGVYVEDTKGATVFDTVVIDGNTASGNGGGIFLYDPDADVIVKNATITDNVASNGGGIYLYGQDNGSFTISNSSISGNEATSGGGVYLYDIDHPVSISDSTISDNTATLGGGININRISAPAEISNSTISGNTATGAGGGVRLARGGGLTLAHSTITANSAVDAGGARFPGPVSMSHVIIAGNTAATTADLHAAGGVTADFSIIGTMIGAVTDGGGNHLGVTDPMLGPLTDNGGPTLTHLPLAGSPAIDKGNPAVSARANDQRGMPRVDGTIDIGAVEIQGSTIQFDATSVTVAENAATVAVNVTRTGTGDLPAAVEIATADGTAIAPGDYGTVSTALSWSARETGTKTISIPVVSDAADETDETFTVALTGPTGATLGSTTSVTVTIIDDDVPSHTFVGFKGSVVDTSGSVVGGATVTLLRSDSQAGPFTVVPDQAALMSPANRQNPDVTDGAGHFGWEVAAGFYRVRAERAGCVSAADPGVAYVESATLTVPPAVTDLRLVLTCAGPNHLPTAPDLSVSTVGAPLTVDLLAGVHDVDGDAVSFVSASSPSHGTLTCSASGVCTYAPAPGFVGTDSFVYWVVDARSGGSSGTVTVNVSGVNHPPVAQFVASPTCGSAPLTVAFDASTSSDAEGVTSYQWDFGDGTSGSGVSLSHAYDLAGSYQVTLTVTDTSGATAVAMATITVVPGSTTDSLTLDRFGSTSYHLAGTLCSGDFVVTTRAGRLVSVIGSGVVSGVTVTIDLTVVRGHGVGSITITAGDGHVIDQVTFRSAKIHLRGSTVISRINWRAGNVRNRLTLTLVNTAT